MTRTVRVEAVVVGVLLAVTGFLVNQSPRPAPVTVPEGRTGVQDGSISDHEAKWLRSTLFADGKIDDREWKFLQELNKKATSKANSFIQLYNDAEKKHGKSKK